MSIFSFVKEAGEKLINLLTPGNANAGEELKKHVQEVGLGNPNITATVDGDKVTVSGEVATQEEKEKIILAAGNIEGVASVEDQITVTGPAVVASRFVVVKKGDTLSAISLQVYGNANQYNKIFEANKPLLPLPLYPIIPNQSAAGCNEVFPLVHWPPEPRTIIVRVLYTTGNGTLLTLLS